MLMVAAPDICLDIMGVYSACNLHSPRGILASTRLVLAFLTLSPELHAAGCEALLSLGTSHQESRVCFTHPHTGSTTGIARQANRSIFSPANQDPSRKVLSPEGQAVLANRQMTSPDGQAFLANRQMTSPERQAFSANRQVTSPEGQALSANRQVIPPEGQALSANRQATSPEGQAVSAYRQITSPEGQESLAVINTSLTQSVGPKEPYVNSGIAQLAPATNRRPESTGLNLSPVPMSGPAKPVDNADALSPNRDRPLRSVTIAEGTSDSRQGASPEATSGQSCGQPSPVPGRSHGALSPVNHKGLLPTQPMGSAGANRQMPSPARDRGASPARLTDLQKQNDALRFKLQVCYVYTMCIRPYELMTTYIYCACCVRHDDAWQVMHDH